MKLSFFLILVGVVTVSGILLSGCASKSMDKTSMQIGDQYYVVELALTSQQQAQGLSGRTEIGSDGMLFVFNTTDRHSFWMKDMKFDLDFIWIKNGEVVEITKNVKKPEGSTQQLPILTPKEPVDMMLEVAAGFSEKQGVSVGDVVLVQLEK